MKDEIRNRCVSVACRTSKPTPTKGTRSRASNLKRGSTTTTDAFTPRVRSGSRKHPHTGSTTLTGGELAAQPQSLRRARGASVATTVAPEGIETLDVASVTRYRGSDCGRIPRASGIDSTLVATARGNSSRGFSSRGSTAMSPPLPISAGNSASNSCSVASRRSEDPSPGSPRASPRPLPAASSTLASSIDGSVAQLCLTPSPPAAPPYAAFTTPRFKGHTHGSGSAPGGAGSKDLPPRHIGIPGSGNLDKDSSSCSFHANQNPTSPQTGTRVHSPLPVIQQRGAEMQRRPSFAPQPPLHALPAAPSMPELGVPSVNTARQPLPPPPLVHQRSQSMPPLEDGQRGAWSVKGYWPPAGSPLSFGARSLSLMSPSRPSSRGDRSSPRERSNGGHRAVVFQFTTTEHEEGSATTTPPRDHSISKSMCSLSMPSAATSMVDELPPPPPPPPPQLSIGRGVTSGGGTPPPPPPRVSVPTSQPLHPLAGSGSCARAPSEVHGRDYARNDSAGGGVLDASIPSSPHSSSASSSWRENTGHVKPFLLSPVTSPHKSLSSSILVPSAAIPGTSEDGTTVSDANGLPSHYPSSATSLRSALVKVQSIVSTDGVGEEEDTVGLRQAVAPPLSLRACFSASALVSTGAATSSTVKNDALGADADKRADVEPITINGASDPVGEPAQSSESPTPRPPPPPVAVKTTQGVGRSNSNRDHNSKPSSGGASGKNKVQISITILQEPLLVSSEISAHTRLAKAQALSPRQQELAQSFRNRIQVGVCPLPPQRSVHPVTSASRDRRRSGGGSTTNRDTSRYFGAGRSGITRRRERTVRRAKNQPTQQPVAALSFIAVVMAAVAYAKLLRLVHAFRVRRHFDEVIAPTAAYRIQCKWRRCLQLRRVEQKTAAQLLVPWIRFRLQRLRRAKDASARLLQRVFRGEVVRSLHRYLYEQIKLNRALDVIRRYVERWEAQNLYRRLQMQRDERVIVVSQCVQGSLQLFRAEQVEWNAIVRDGAETLKSRPCVSTQDWVEGVAALTGVVLDPRASNRIRSPDASPVVSTSAGSTCAAQLRACLAGFARLEHQRFRSRDITDDKTASSSEGSAPSSAVLPPWPLQPTPALEMRVTKLIQGEREGSSVAAHGDDAHSHTAASTAGDGASDSPTSSASLATEDDLVTTYVQLLCRTEAAERVALERRLLDEHQGSRDITDDKTASSSEGSAPSSAVLPPWPLQPTPALEMRVTKLIQGEREGSSVAAHGDDAHSHTAASTAGDGASDSPTSSASLATEDDLVTTYVQLLCRTEAAERVALERRLLDEHQEFLREPVLRCKAISYAIEMRVPPLFSPLLLSMPSDLLLRQAAHLFKTEREARCEIIQLYESMPLACLSRPMLNPAAKARHSELVRLVNAVDNPWSDAERSERRFYCETAAYKHLASSTNKLESGISLSYTPQPSSIPLGPDNVPCPRLTGPSHAATHNNGGYSVPLLQHLPRPTSYGTSSGLRVCMNVTPHIHYYANSLITASLPAHATLLLPPSNNAAASSVPEGGGAAETDKDDRHTNSYLASWHRGRSEAQGKTAIPSPHRRPRGPPLPLLRKLLQSSGRARSGTSRLPLQRLPLVSTHVRKNREGASGPWPPLLSTYPNTTDFWLVDIRGPSTEQEGRDPQVGIAGSSQRSTNDVSQDADPGFAPRLLSPAIVKGGRCTTTARPTSAAPVVAAGHFSDPRGFRAPGPVTISSHFSGNVIENTAVSGHEKTAPLHRTGLVERTHTAQPVGAPDPGFIPLTTTVRSMSREQCSTAAPREPLAPSLMLQELPLCQRKQNDTPVPARVGKDTPGDPTLLSAPTSDFSSAYVASALMISTTAANHPRGTWQSSGCDPSLLYMPLSMRSEVRDGDGEAGGAEADAELHQGQQQQQKQKQPSTTSAASAAQVPTPLAACRGEAVDFPPTPALSSSALTVAERGADGGNWIPLTPQRLRPPTPPPRQCHTAQSAAHVGEAPERSTVRTIVAANPADRAGHPVSHNAPASAGSLISPYTHRPHHWAAVHSAGRKTNAMDVKSSGISSSDVKRARMPTVKTLLSPAAPVVAAVAAETQPLSLSRG
ncbi:conserved hypothetical protein [Leishmania mexicana MHOM/GT/2001/U1103]|uniref:Uncharacterized protein n=1 Tax=Leishmania mexicana (strain MHOM/GT/2001/U1103) TaxID=929439 RepID=E9ARN4_LEIMU|nr:conserved hypothetical protein [Leishmania mexicana MHOM/GT/2001/U1103]CBZ25605.1 conserved hypothetical protein [Leishmania mexicana MHOM/GT/2001/U1103]